MDSDTLISKKELLKEAGISYGQLYRWKRKGLIPDDWFIRRSTFTGQETFFPRDKIIKRVDSINNMKGDISLDDLAGMFSTLPENILLPENEIKKRGIAGDDVCAIYSEIHEKQNYDFTDLICVMVLQELLKSGNLGRDESICAAHTVKSGMEHYKDGFFELFAVRRLGLFTCFAASMPCDILFESGTHLTARISVPEISQKLKLKLL